MGSGVAGRPRGRVVSGGRQASAARVTMGDPGRSPRGPLGECRCCRCSRVGQRVVCSHYLGSRLPWGDGTVSSGRASTSLIATVGTHPSAWRGSATVAMVQRVLPRRAQPVTAWRHATATVVMGRLGQRIPPMAAEASLSPRVGGRWGRHDCRCPSEDGWWCLFRSVALSAWRDAMAEGHFPAKWQATEDAPPISRDAAPPRPAR
ncbi:UNVERIFIED_CONTAM: hypothetical protein K2H54_070550 [Gekko kuhli]